MLFFHSKSSCKISLCWDVPGSQWWFNHQSLLFSLFHIILQTLSTQHLRWECGLLNSFFLNLWTCFSIFDMSELLLSSKLFINYLRYGLQLRDNFNSQENKNQRLTHNTTKGITLVSLSSTSEDYLIMARQCTMYSYLYYSPYFYTTGMSK